MVCESCFTIFLGLPFRVVKGFDLVEAINKLGTNSFNGDVHARIKITVRPTYVARHNWRFLS